MRRVLSPLAVIAVCLLGLVGGAALPASASANPDVAKSFTRVAIDPDVAALLEAFGVDLIATGRATVGPYKGTIAAEFPIKSVKENGKLIKNTGGLQFAFSGKDLAAKNYTFNLKKNTASGVVSGSEVGDLGRIPLFTLSDSTMPDLGDYNLALTQEAADAFNATFGADVVSAGDILGYAAFKV